MSRDAVTRDDTDVLLPLVGANKGQRRLRCLSLPVFSLALAIDWFITLRFRL